MEENSVSTKQIVGLLSQKNKILSEIFFFWLWEQFVVISSQCKIISTDKKCIMCTYYYVHLLLVTTYSQPLLWTIDFVNVSIIVNQVCILLFDRLYLRFVRGFVFTRNFSTVHHCFHWSCRSAYLIYISAQYHISWPVSGLRLCDYYKRTLLLYLTICHLGRYLLKIS